MASLPNSKTVTYEEWLRMPEVQDFIEEVVNGEVRIMPPAKFKHALIVERLRKALDTQLDNARFLVLATSFGLVIRKKPLTSRVPDLAVFELSTIVEQDGYIHSAPQLAVEVLSPGNARREREEKRADYASIGVPEFWLISPKSRTVEVLYLEDGQFRTARTMCEGILTLKQYPDVQIDIGSIWPE